MLRVSSTHSCVLRSLWRINVTLLYSFSNRIRRFRGSRCESGDLRIGLKQRLLPPFFRVTRPSSLRLLYITRIFGSLLVLRILLLSSALLSSEGEGPREEALVRRAPLWGARREP